MEDSGKKGILLVASGNTLAAELAGEMILLDQASGQYFGLNRVGAFAWRFFRIGTSAAAVAAAVAEQFDVGPERAASDVAAWVEDLARVGLVQEDSDPTDNVSRDFVGPAVVGEDARGRAYERPVVLCWGTVEQLTATGGGAGADAASQSGGGGVEY